MATLDGPLADLSLLETYVPIMSGDTFLGAFEIYQDVTSEVRRLDALSFRVQAGSIGLSLLLLLLAVV